MDTECSAILTLCAVRNTDGKEWQKPSICEEGPNRLPLSSLPHVLLLTETSFTELQLSITCLLALLASKRTAAVANDKRQTHALAHRCYVHGDGASNHVAGKAFTLPRGDVHFDPHA